MTARESRAQRSVQEQVRKELSHTVVQSYSGIRVSVRFRGAHRRVMHLEHLECGMQPLPQEAGRPPPFADCQRKAWYERDTSSPMRCLVSQRQSACVLR